MKRFTNLICGLTLAASFMGCGNTGGATGGGGDLAVKPVPDLGKAPPDIAKPTGAFTGEPRTVNGDCLPSVSGTSVAAPCVKTLNMLTYKNGYCSSPCRPTKTDQGTGLNSDCPSDAAACQLVSQTAGRCVKLCMDATMDCRFDEDYICENNAYLAASCTPKSKDWCDPKVQMCPKSAMGNAQLCVSFSPDESAGQCAEICDVFQQNCTQPAMGTNACLANPTTGQATCINTNTGMDGDTCRYLNDCVPGLACHTENMAGVCRQYCRTGTGVDAGAGPDGGVADVTCPMGQMCVDLSMTVKKNKIGICSK